MMTEDEMEVDAQTQPDSIDASSQPNEPQKVPLRDDQPPVQRLRDGKGDETGASDDSFVSAKEQESDVPIAVDEEMEDAAPVEEQLQHELEETVQDEIVADAEVNDENGPEPAREEIHASQEGQDNDVDIDMEDGASPQSDGLSPEKPLQRKSSFTFSSLPAREPLGAKRSMGQIGRDRSSVFNKSISKPADPQQDDEDNPQEKAAEARAHSKSSAQLLHERLNMLGKTKEARTSKSIAQPSYPQLPESEPANSQATEVFDQAKLASKAAPVEDDEDDWIAPTKSVQSKFQEVGVDDVAKHTSPARPAMHQKSISTTYIPSPSRPEMAAETRHQKAISVSHPNLTEALESTTPAGSPMGKKTNDGPLSASKSRLWSAFKSAKNIFASSASASAAAKLEAHRDSPVTRSQKRDSGESKIFNMPGGIFSQKDILQSPAKNGSVISLSPSRKTRSSTESDKRKEKEIKAQEKAANELEKAREKERQKAAKQQAEEQAKAEKAERAEAARLEKERQKEAAAAAHAERPGTADSGKASESDNASVQTSKGGLTGKLRAPGRLMRPTREQAKPAPVSIKVASQSQRLGQSTTTFGKPQQDNSAPTKQAGPRASSAMGNRPGSAVPSNSRVKALEAAARRKEADEKAAAKKAEQKRELERKRAEKAEQEKRAEEERKAAEQQRVQEAKLAAQRKQAERQAAAEARKREQERAEQQKREQEQQQRREQERVERQRREQEEARKQEEVRKQREAHELAEAIRRERAQQQTQTHPRGDVPGTLRQLTKSTIAPANTAKPAKRMLFNDDDEPSHQPQRPGIVRGPPSYQQTDAKRRRTNEEQEEADGRRSVMAPPKRPSTLRKVRHQPRLEYAQSNEKQETLSKFSGYTHAPPPAAHHASMFKATVTAQHQMQHGSKPTHPSQLVQMSNARIPFAENANPPATSQHPSHSQMHPGYENAQQNKFKTPARPAHAPKSARSTPHYPQGDNIELPDIATDSEDEDSEDENDGFRAPSWVASPALRDLLTQQQLVDPETVFGPIGELKMDEVFKNSKNPERAKKFRDRGSSAMWVETGDAVTSAEKRKDMEMRERVARDGGWRYEPNAS